MSDIHLAPCRRSCQGPAQQADHGIRQLEDEAQRTSTARLNTLVRHMQAQNPDFIAVTGDHNPR
jgi:hypothetical protein